MAKPIVIRSGEGWEIVNEDGLIYKRRRKEDAPVPEAPERLPICPQNNPHWRRQRKKAALQQLKSRYVAEIHEWETLIQKLEKPSEKPTEPKGISDSLTPQKLATAESLEDKSVALVETLLCEVERMEMFMEELKILCCDVEYMCKRPDDNGVFFHHITSPRLLVEALEASAEEASPSKGTP